MKTHTHTQIPSQDQKDNIGLGETWKGTNKTEPKKSPISSRRLVMVLSKRWVTSVQCVHNGALSWCAVSFFLFDIYRVRYCACCCCWFLTSSSRPTPRWTSERDDAILYLFSFVISGFWGNKIRRCFMDLTLVWVCWKDFSWIAIFAKWSIKFNLRIKFLFNLTLKVLKCLCNLGQILNSSITYSFWYLSFENKSDSIKNTCLLYLKHLKIKLWSNCSERVNIIWQCCQLLRKSRFMDNIENSINKLFLCEKLYCVWSTKNWIFFFAKIKFLNWTL